MAAKDNNSPPNSLNGFNGSTAKSTARNSMSPLRQRPLGRTSTFAELHSPRRSSNLSGSVDDARQSIRSSTDDLLLPRIQRTGLQTHKESSHWQSAPLGLALFPAIGGMLFQNGSVILTDLTLLGIAAVFLNWSVRVPWDWYRSTQAAHQDDSFPPTPHPRPPSDTILEEDGEDDEDAQSEYPTPPEFKSPPPDPSQVAASAQLRIYELLALIACFLFPMIGTWLLHHIRSQLSRPSEGLVSNYNLTIFLLASELRPLSHLIKLVQARTLHLQRIACPADTDLSSLNPQSISALTTRLDELEAHIASSAQASDSKPTVNGGPPSNQETINTVRKSLTPDIEALNRAVRRYEKRATLLSMQTESRLSDLESRLSDAITLAAAAERNVSNFNRKSYALVLVEWASAAILLPLQAGYSIAIFPVRVAGGALGWVEGVVGGKVRKEVRTAIGTNGGRDRERGSGGSGVERERRREKGLLKIRKSGGGG